MTTEPQQRHDEPPADLRGQVTRGLSWKAASQIMRQLTRVAVIVVIAHELTPREYGLAGMVLVFSTLVLVFADLALGAALVQRAELSERDRSTVFWASALTGVVFTMLGFALAGPIAGFFGEPDVAPLLRAFSVTFLLTALSTTQFAMLTRELSFKALELRSMAASLISSVVGIGLAVGGVGAWAIIGQQLTIAFVSTTSLWLLSPWRPSGHCSLASLKALGSFGLGAFATRLVFYLERNADNVLVGRFLGSHALGVYAISYNVMLVPLEQVGGPMADVLFPAFSRLQGNLGRLAAAWLRAVRMLAAIVIPAMLLLIVLAPDVVPVLLGAKWHEAVLVIQLLAWIGLHQSLQRFNSSVLLALGRTRPLVSYAVVSAIVNISAFGLGLQWGVVGVAAAYAISSTLVAPLYLVLTTRALELPVRGFFANLAGIATAASGAALATLAVRWAIVGSVDSHVLRLLVTVPVGIGVYAVLCRWRAPELVADIASHVPHAVRVRFERRSAAIAS